MHGALLDCFAQLQLKAMTDGQGRKGCYFENDPEMFWHRLDSDQVQHSPPVVSAFHEQPRFYEQARYRRSPP
jgi:hypothetical protein